MAKEEFGLVHYASFLSLRRIFDNYNLFDEIIIEMNKKKLMKLDERKRNFPLIITVDDALMNTIQRKKNDQLGSKLSSFFFLKIKLMMMVIMICFSLQHNLTRAYVRSFQR